MALATRVVDFSTGASMAASGVSIFLDAEKNVNTAGEQVSSFIPGDTIWLLATMPETIRLVRVASTAGSVSLHGTVTRSQTDQLLFAVAGEELTLSRQPLSGPSITWWGKVGSIDADVDKAVVMATANSGLPCLGDLSYGYKAESISLQTTPMTLAEDETYPYGVVLYVEVLS